MSNQCDNHLTMVLGIAILSTKAGVRVLIPYIEKAKELEPDVVGSKYPTDDDDELLCLQ